VSKALEASEVQRVTPMAHHAGRAAAAAPPPVIQHQQQVQLHPAQTATLQHMNQPGS